jgi:hypothetical protein
MQSLEQIQYFIQNRPICQFLCSEHTARNFQYEYTVNELSSASYLKKVGDNVGLSVTEEGGESAVDPRESLCIWIRLKLSDFGLR